MRVGEDCPHVGAAARDVHGLDEARAVRHVRVALALHERDVDRVEDAHGAGAAVDRDPLVAAPLVLPSAQRRVEGDARVAQVLDRVGEGLATCGWRVLRPRGVFTGSSASKGVEYGPPATASARPAKRRKRMAPLESRSSCRSQARSAGQASSARGVIARHMSSKLVAPQLARVLAVVEHGVLQSPSVNGRRRPSTSFRPEARAQAPRGALVADDAGEALERLLGVRQPVGVVRVRHVVVTEERGLVARSEDAGQRPRRHRRPSRTRSASRRGRVGEWPGRSPGPAVYCRCGALSSETLGIAPMSA